MSEGAVLSILAVHQVLGELGAELGLVLLDVVQPLHPVVGHITLVPFFASVCLSMIAHLGRIHSIILSSPVLVSVKVRAVLVIVIVVYRALLNLKFLQIQVLYFFAKVGRID